MIGSIASSEYDATIDPEKAGEVIHPVTADWKHPGSSISMMFEGVNFKDDELEGHCNYGMDGRMYIQGNKNGKRFRAVLDVRDLVQDFLDHLPENNNDAT